LEADASSSNTRTGVLQSLSFVASASVSEEVLEIVEQLGGTLMYQLTEQVRQGPILSAVFFVTDRVSGCAIIPGYVRAVYRQRCR